MKIVELFPNLPTIELAGRQRALHFGVLAVGQLEHFYGSIEGVYAAVARAKIRHAKTARGIEPVPAVDDLLQVLWACLLEDAEDHREQLTIPTVRRAMRLDQISAYQALISEAVALASPTPGPTVPGPEATSGLGTGDGPTRGPSATVDGTNGGSFTPISGS
jgi:hypothetical protein